MTSDEVKEWSNLSDISDFFFRLEMETELDYMEGKIKKGQRNRKIGQINKAWRIAMLENNPLIKNNPQLRKIADNLFQNRDFG